MTLETSRYKYAWVSTNEKARSEEHTSELQSRTDPISYAVFCLGSIQMVLDIPEGLTYVAGSRSLATGSTPLKPYGHMIKLYEAGAVDFSKVTTFNLDEYCKLDVNDVVGVLDRFS